MTGLPLTGVAQILDALLVIADDGHAPGTRVRMPAEATATLVGARWGATGPPIAYRVHPDGAGPDVLADPVTLVVLSGELYSPYRPAVS